MFRNNSSQASHFKSCWWFVIIWSTRLQLICLDQASPLLKFTAPLSLDFYENPKRKWVIRTKWQSVTDNLVGLLQQFLPPYSHILLLVFLQLIHKDNFRQCKWTRTRFYHDTALLMGSYWLWNWQIINLGPIITILNNTLYLLKNN